MRRMPSERQCFGAYEAIFGNEGRSLAGRICDVRRQNLPTRGEG